MPMAHARPYTEHTLVTDTVTQDIIRVTALLNQGATCQAERCDTDIYFYATNTCPVVPYLAREWLVANLLAVHGRAAFAAVQPPIDYISEIAPL